MLHQTPKNCGALGHGKRSPQKKAAVTTFKGARLLKWLVAYCVLHSVSATAETMPALSPFTSPSPTCGCSEEIVALQEKEVAHAAALEALRLFVGMTPPSAPPSPPPSTPPSPPPPSPSPPPPSPSPPPPSPSPPPPSPSPPPPSPSPPSLWQFKSGLSCEANGCQRIDSEADCQAAGSLAGKSYGLINFANEPGACLYCNDECGGQYQDKYLYNPAGLNLACNAHPSYVSCTCKCLVTPN